jgi:hypothetical protein
MAGGVLGDGDLQPGIPTLNPCEIGQTNRSGRCAGSREEDREE